MSTLLALIPLVILVLFGAKLNESLKDNKIEYLRKNGNGVLWTIYILSYGFGISATFISVEWRIFIYITFWVVVWMFAKAYGGFKESQKIPLDDLMIYANKELGENIISALYKIELWEAHLNIKMTEEEKQEFLTTVIRTKNEIDLKERHLNSKMSQEEKIEFFNDVIKKRMENESASENQLKRIAYWGYDIVNVRFTKKMCSEIISTQT